MQSTLPAIATAIALFALGAPARAADFTKIADTATQSGDGSTLYTFNNPQIAGGTTAFIARSLNGLTAIYSAPTAGGALIKLADTKTKVPGGKGDFTPSRTYFSAFSPSGCSPPIVGTQSVVFVGMDAIQNAGLYSVPIAGGVVKKIADYTTAIPGAPLPPSGYTTFNKNYSFCHLAIVGTTVVFDAGVNSGVYSVQTNGTKLTRIADANTPTQAPGPFPVVNGYGLPSVQGKNITYIGSTTGGPFGIFYGGLTGLGSLVVYAQSSEGNNYDQYAYPTLNGSSIAYSALLSGTDNVLATVNTAGTAGTLIFDDVTSKVPPNTLGDAFNQTGTDSVNFLGKDTSRAIFSAVTYDKSPKPYATYDGVFSACSTKLSKLFQTGDAVGTQQLGAIGGISLVQRISVGGAMVDQLAALVTLSAPGAPSINDGAPAIYTVTVPVC